MRGVALVRGQRASVIWLTACGCRSGCHEVVRMVIRFAQVTLEPLQFKHLLHTVPGSMLALAWEDRAERGCTTTRGGALHADAMVTALAKAGRCVCFARHASASRC